jgi:hypothetical protein
MGLFQIGVTFFEYAAWIYSGMSAVSLRKTAHHHTKPNSFTDFTDPLADLMISGKGYMFGTRV